MSLRQLVSRSIHTLLLAAATAAAAFGMLVAFRPLDGTPPPRPSTGNPALHAKIDSARAALRETETALNSAAVGATSIAAPADSTQLEAQIAAATERRDLALRHAQAIRDGLEAGGILASLAEVRDSVVVGQLLSQQAALDAELAEQGARLKPSHPTMRALLAQKRSLVAQISAQAAAIADALDSEAKMDDEQINNLQSQLAAIPPAPAKALPQSTQALTAKAASQRAELESLMDSYLQPPGAATVSPAPNLLGPLNLLVVAVAFAAAILFRIALVLRRARRDRSADIARWQADHDPETITEPPSVSEPDAVLRRAS
jgi:uncharacterized protein involved in exopolysaccharide biosynthesis